MIEISRFERRQRTILIIRLSGRLTKQQFEGFRAQVESEVRHHKNLRLMFEIADDLRWDPRSRWYQLRFDSRHHTSIYRLAVVGGDKPWQRWIWTACLPMSVEQGAFFSLAQKSQAYFWLQQSNPTS